MARSLQLLKVGDQGLNSTDIKDDYLVGALG